MELTYKQDWDSAKSRIEAFWKGESIGRPFAAVNAPKGERKYLQYPRSFREKVLDYDYRIQDEEETIKATYYGGEAVPCVWPDFSPDFTAACIGGDLDISNRSPDMSIGGAFWAKHILNDWEKDLHKIKFDPESVWFRRGVEYTKLAIQKSAGRYLVESLDVDGGMDTAAGLRGAERLCMDLLDCPENIGALLDKIREGNKQVVENLYSLVKDGQGGMINTYRIYAPGKTYNMRSDFSFMIHPDMFRDIVLPYMIKESEIADYIIFHTHTEDIKYNFENRMKYLDVILDIPKVHAVEWCCPNSPLEVRVPGIKRIIEKGKYALTSGTAEQLLALSKMFGRTERNRMIYIAWASTIKEAEDFLIGLERL